MIFARRLTSFYAPYYTMPLSPCSLMAALWVAALLGQNLSAQTVSPIMKPDPEMRNGLVAHENLWIEQLNWIEVRDLIRAGKSTAIVGTGGIEMNGPYTATGKHNSILQATLPTIARRLGNALIAPIVPFVPEGNFDPPTGHMLYPGSFSVTEETFRALLTDIARSLRLHGFRDIIFVGAVAETKLA